MAQGSQSPQPRVPEDTGMQGANSEPPCCAQNHSSAHSREYHRGFLGFQTAMTPPSLFATLHIHVTAVTQHPGREKKQTKDIIANLYGKSIKFRHLINLLTCLSPSFNLHYCLQMDLTHWPTTSLGRCNKHEQSPWIPEYSIYPGPSLPPPCHSLNAKKHWKKKIGHRK